jgi:hypothetical protein
VGPATATVHRSRGGQTPSFAYRTIPGLVGARLVAIVRWLGESSDPHGAVRRDTASPSLRLMTRIATPPLMSRRSPRALLPPWLFARATLLAVIASTMVACRHGSSADVATLAAGTDYISARQYLGRLIESFPNSPHQPLARLPCAGGAENYVLAANDYREFRGVSPSPRRADVRESPEATAVHSTELSISADFWPADGQTAILRRVYAPTRCIPFVTCSYQWLLVGTPRWVMGNKTREVETRFPPGPLAAEHVKLRLSSIAGWELRTVVIEVGAFALVLDPAKPLHGERLDPVVDGVYYCNVGGMLADMTRLTGERRTVRLPVPRFADLRAIRLLTSAGAPAETYLLSRILRPESYHLKPAEIMRRLKPTSSGRWGLAANAPPNEPWPQRAWQLEKDEAGRPSYVESGTGARIAGLADPMKTILLPLGKTALLPLGSNAEGDVDLEFAIVAQAALDDLKIAEFARSSTAFGTGEGGPEEGCFGVPREVWRLLLARHHGGDEIDVHGEYAPAQATVSGDAFADLAITAHREIRGLALCGSLAHRADSVVWLFCAKLEVVP